VPVAGRLGIAADVELKGGGEGVDGSLAAKAKPPAAAAAFLLLLLLLSLSIPWDLLVAGENIAPMTPRTSPNPNLNNANQTNFPSSC